MAEQTNTYYSTAVTDASGEWKYIDDMLGYGGFGAQVLLISGSNSNKYVTVTEHEYTSSGTVIIFKVDLYVGSLAADWDLQIIPNVPFWVQPWFNGTTSGTTYSGTYCPVCADNHHIDITYDPAAPASGTWTMSDVVNLDWRFWFGDYSGPSTTVSGYVLQSHVDITLEFDNTYGLEIYDANGNLRVSGITGLSRMIYTTTVSGGDAGSTVVSGAYPGTERLDAFGYCLEDDKLSHILHSYKFGDDLEFDYEPRSTVTKLVIEDTDDVVVISGTYGVGSGDTRAFVFSYS